MGEVFFFCYFFILPVTGALTTGVDGFLTRNDFVLRKDRRKDRRLNDRKMLAALAALLLELFGGVVATTTTGVDGPLDAAEATGVMTGVITRGRW